MAVHQQAQREKKKFQSNGTRDTDDIETKRALNIVGE